MGLRRVCLTAAMGTATLGAVLVAPALASAAPPEAPLTEAATSITGASATLDGELNPNAGATVYWYFAYSYPNGSSCQEGPSAWGGEAQGQALKESLPLEGLEPNRTYRFCLVAINPETWEASVGNEEAFSTLALKPTVDGESASAISASDAHLEAQINPNNEETTYRFLYATNEALSGAVSVPGEGPLGAFYWDQSVSVDLEGKLAPYTTYYYHVIAENAAGTTEGSLQSFTTPAPPIATIGEAQEIVRDAATISGTVDPAGLESTYHFQFGTTTAYGQNAPTVQGSSLPAGFGATPVSVRITGLTPDTVYHYRIVASNREGTTCSSDQTLTTASATPPVISAESASGITLTTASLSAALDPQGLESSYVLELGTDTSYGTSISGEVGAASEAVSIAVPVIELAPGTTYHYRFVAVNPDGRTLGVDQTFSTPAYQHPIVLPPSEPLLGAPQIAFPAVKEEGAKPKPHRHRRKGRHHHKRRRRGGAHGRRRRG